MNQEVKVEVKDGLLIISVGIDTLKSAAELCPLLYDINDDQDYPKVVDKDEFIKDLKKELLDEWGEDGLTILHNMFDMAFANMYDEGSLAFEDKNG